MSPAVDLSQYKEEIIDGKVYYMSPSAHPKHGRVIGKIFRAFSNYLDGKMCEAFTDTIDIYLDLEKKDVVIPDVSVLCDPNKFTNRGYEGVPALIVEVISPISVYRDKVLKYRTYEKYGVKEYWVIDPISKTIEINELINGKYQLVNVCAFLEEEDILRLSEQERNELKSEISPSSFPKLIIRLNEIF